MSRGMIAAREAQEQRVNAGRTTMPRRKNNKPVVGETPPPGPVSIFRRKVRKPVTLTLTPEHHVKVNLAMRRLKLSRADVIALLIDQYADTIEQQHG